MNIYIIIKKYLLKVSKKDRNGIKIYNEKSFKNSNDIHKIVKILLKKMEIRKY